MADLILLFPRQSARQTAGYLVYHPERRLIMPKLTLLDWRRLEGLCRYSVVRMRDYLYFIGGYQPAKKKFSRQVLRYELSSGSWYYCNKMKTPRADFQAFAYDGKIYCPGGRTVGGELTDRMESFEPVTNAWFQENPLPAPCAEFACVCLDQLSTVLLVGGVARSPNGSYRCFGQVWRFGLLKSSNPYLDYEYLWQALPPDVGVPTSLGVRGHQLVLDVNFNRVYLVGGSPHLAGANKRLQQDSNKRESPPKSRLPGLYYFSVDDLKKILDDLDSQQEQEGQTMSKEATPPPPTSSAAATTNMYWMRRHIEECSRSYSAVSLVGSKLFVIGGTPVEASATKAAGRDATQTPGDATQTPGDATQTPGDATTDEAAASSAAATPFLDDAASSSVADVGYYDKRRKTFHSLFSLRNSGLATGDLLGVTVRLEKSNKDLKQDRLDWLLQWSLW